MNILNRVPAVFLMLKMMSINKRFIMISSIIYLAILIGAAYTIGYWALLLFIISFPVFIAIMSITTALKFKKQMMNDPLAAMMQMMPSDIGNMMQMVNEKIPKNKNVDNQIMVNSNKKSDVTDVEEKKVK